MPGPILHLGATVMCSHGGQAMPTAPSTRVMVAGQPVSTMTAPYSVAGCAFVPPGGNGPCVTAQWIVAATRVMSQGQPVVLLDSQSICTPTGTPLLCAAAQTRVLGS